MRCNLINMCTFKSISHGSSNESVVRACGHERVSRVLNVITRTNEMWPRKIKISFVVSLTRTFFGSRFLVIFEWPITIRGKMDVTKSINVKLTKGLINKTIDAVEYLKVDFFTDQQIIIMFYNTAHSWTEECGCPSNYSLHIFTTIDNRITALVTHHIFAALSLTGGKSCMIYRFNYIRIDVPRPTVKEQFRTNR